MRRESIPPIEDRQAWAELTQTTSRQYAVALVEGYPFTGFAVVDMDGRWHWPPSVLAPLDWKYFFDVRLFGLFGQWHFWSMGTSWQGRFAQPTSDEVQRVDVIRGNFSDTRETDGVFWTLLADQQGTRIWIPGQLKVKSEPVRLKIAQSLACDPKSGLVSVVKARLCHLENLEPWQTGNPSL